MHRSLSRLTLVVVVAIVSGHAYAAEADDLARVAIVEYVDETGTSSFQYLSTSLTEAVDTSMRKRFEYRRIEPSRVGSARAKNKKRVSKEEAEKLAAKLDADILVSGNYSLNATKTRVKIYTNIFLREGAAWVNIPEVSNKVDSTIFNATEKVSARTVQEINRIAEAQANRDPENKKAQKLKQKLEKGMSLAPSWKSKKWIISLVLGPAFGVTVFDGAKNGSFGLSGRRVLSGSWYAGAALNMMPELHKENEGNFVAFKNAVSISALGGYSIDFYSRFRYFAEAGAGYYRANLKLNAGTVSTVTAIGNPYMRFNTGIDYLVFQNWALGLNIAFDMYYDSPEPLITSHVQLGFSYTF